MKPKHIIIHILAVLLALPLTGTSARALTIDVIETFDYPGSALTRPQKINDHGVIAGIFVDPATGGSEGFFRSRGGRFSDPIIEPNTDANFTEVRGINNRRTICGDYMTSDGVFHGFFLSQQEFTEFDLPPETFTIVLGINNAEDFCGSFLDVDAIQKGFVSLGGSVTSFSVPGSVATHAYQVNDSNQITGYYTDEAATPHGYLRDSDGTITAPIDPAGSTGTILFGNNASNWVVGRYSDAVGNTHGLFFITPGDFVTFDFPGSIFTSFNGINRQGWICGRYIDTSGFEHGILAKVNLHAADQPNKTGNLPVIPVKPATPNPPQSRIVAPAS
jgi:hypothetical protein